MTRFDAVFGIAILALLVVDAATWVVIPNSRFCYAPQTSRGRRVLRITSGFAFAVSLFLLSLPAPTVPDRFLNVFRFAGVLYGALSLYNVWHRMSESGRK